MMSTQTRLFNIRITNDLHAKFKEYASEKGVSMGGILLNYIEHLIEHEGEVYGFEDGRKTAKWNDPLDAIRDQYQAGEDF